MGFFKYPTPQVFSRKCLTCFLFSTSESVRDLILLPDYLPDWFTDLDFVPVFPSLWAWYFLLFKLCFVCFCFSSFYVYYSELHCSLIFLIYSLLFVTLLLFSTQYILQSSCENITKLYELLWNTIHIDVISTLSLSLLYQSKKVRFSIDIFFSLTKQTKPFDMLPGAAAVLLQTWLVLADFHWVALLIQPDSALISPCNY